MRYDLALAWKRLRKPRKRTVTLRPVIISATLATDLYRSCYRPVIAAWEQAIPALIAEYERTFAELVQDSPAEVGEVVTRTENTVTTLLMTVRARLEGWAKRLEAMHRQRWRGAVLTATGVDISTMIGPSDARVTLGAAIERNTGLIRSVSDETRRRIGEAVFGGFNRRDEPRIVAKAIREAVNMERKRALRIAADQNVKLASALNEERRREAGITTWEWRHSGKLHPRVDHVARNGKQYDDDAKSGARKPPADRPGMLPYCGCTSQAVLSLDE